MKFACLVCTVLVVACGNGTAKVRGPDGVRGVCCPIEESCDCRPQGGWAPSLDDCSAECDVGFGGVIRRDEFGCDFYYGGGPCSVPYPCIDQENPEPDLSPVSTTQIDWNPGLSIVLDLETCASEYRTADLPFGSAWVETFKDGDEHCVVRLGGETEDPNYGGEATQYCRFLSNPSCWTEAHLQGSGLEATGGPAFINSAACTTIVAAE